MKKIVIILLFIALISNILGCGTENPKVKDTKTERANVAVKPTMAYKDRVFIYNNGLDIEYKQLKAEDKSKVKSRSSYPIITGLKDKKVQDQLNKEISATLDNMLVQLEAKYPEKKDNISEYEQKRKNARVSYNYNNAIFIDYSANIHASFAGDYDTPIYSYFGIGYDLNTGNRIGLSDLFKPGVDSKKRINTYIGQYIIENNYDDYEYELMTKPFQGIRDDQNYSLNFDSLIINLDEKNDDFVYNGYPHTIQIPLKYFGDDLYIFDKYFDEGKNIYDKDKLTKKLFPNKIGFIPKKYFEDGTDKWHVSIMGGEFTNIPDKTIEKKIGEMLGPMPGAREFKQEAEEYITNSKDVPYYGNYSHNIEVPINAGGYLSIISFDEIYRVDKYKQSRRTFNYDFNRKKEMKFIDLFINDIDIEEIMKKHIREMDYPITEAMIEEGIKAAISSNDFSFSEQHVLFRFSPKEANIDPYQEWIWMDFEEFGLENISLIN